MLSYYYIGHRIIVCKGFSSMEKKLIANLKLTYLVSSYLALAFSART